MYFRDLYNAMQAHRMKPPSPAYRAANFYFIREYCYGSMFRYNANGEFNIPYGGKSYNKKNMRAKIDHIFCDEVRELFANTELCCMDFGDFFRHIHLTERDFMFLDPPYDTDFSDYEGRAFTKKDQERLAAALRETPARFILVIKNTEFIRSLMKRTSISSALTSATPTMSEAGTSAAWSISSSPTYRSDISKIPVPRTFAASIFQCNPPPLDNLKKASRRLTPAGIFLQLHSGVHQPLPVGI